MIVLQGTDFQPVYLHGGEAEEAFANWKAACAQARIRKAAPGNQPAEEPTVIS